jgi:hypothetical protein
VNPPPSGGPNSSSIAVLPLQAVGTDGMTGVSCAAPADDAVCPELCMKEAQPMFATSLVTALAAAVLAPGSAVTPAWQPDYATARTRAGELQRPVAVFIARGGEGATKLVADGGLSAEVAGLLRRGYVPVFADTSTPAGRELAKAFGIDEGLVISDRSGGVQALRHQGTLTRSDLAGYLTRFTGPGAVSQTEYRGAAQVTQAAAPVAARPAYQPVYQPVYQPTFNVVPSYSFYGGT